MTPAETCCVRRCWGQTQKLLAEVMQTFDAMDRLTRRSTSGPGVIHPAVESWEFDVRVPVGAPDRPGGTVVAGPV